MLFSTFVPCKNLTNLNRMIKSLLPRIASVIFLLSFPFLMVAGEIQLTSGKTEFRITSNNYQQLSFNSDISSILFRDI